MNPPTPKQTLLKVSRQAARAGMPFEAVTKGLLPEYRHLISEMRESYDSQKDVVSA